LYAVCAASTNDRRVTIVVSFKQICSLLLDAYRRLGRILTGSQTCALTRTHASVLEACALEDEQMRAALEGHAEHRRFDELTDCLQQVSDQATAASEEAAARSQAARARETEARDRKSVV